MYYSDEINKNSHIDIRDINLFLNKFGVEYDYPQKTFVVRDKGKIISTGSVDGNVLKYFFTADEYKGEGTIAIIYNSLLNYIIGNGMDSFFVFTDPKNKKIFISLGLNLVYNTKEVVLLEGGFYNYSKWIKKVKEKLKPKVGKRGAIVMNCNPMTLGHKYLIELALKKVDNLLIFLVEEDKSVFPFKDRWDILKEELSGYKNIDILESGPYIISSGTFPTYFLKQEDDKLDIYTSLDAGIFKDKIAKDLYIDVRFLGTEPTDNVTRVYNKNLKELFKGSPIDLEIIDRKKMDGDIISASKIRNLLKEGKNDIAFRSLPKSTIDFLKSKRGKNIIKKLK